VHETELIVIIALRFPGAEIVFLDGFAGGAQPLFPFLGALRLLVGVEQQILTYWLASPWGLEQAEGELVEWRRGLPAPSFVPVTVEGRVIPRRRVFDHWCRRVDEPCCDDSDSSRRESFSSGRAHSSFGSATNYRG
jgi:hypothetical protein